MRLVLHKYHVEVTICVCVRVDPPQSVTNEILNVPYMTKVSKMRQFDLFSREKNEL